MVANNTVLQTKSGFYGKENNRNIIALLKEAIKLQNTERKDFLPSTLRFLGGCCCCCSEDDPAAFAFATSELVELCSDSIRSVETSSFSIDDISRKARQFG